MFANLPSKTADKSSIPGQGSKIPHAKGPEQLERCLHVDKESKSYN